MSSGPCTIAVPTATRSSSVVADGPMSDGRAAALEAMCVVAMPPGSSMVTPMPSAASSSRRVSP